MVTCTKCAAKIDKLEVFPGTVCLPCWAASPAGQKVPTAEEVISFWTNPKAWA
jgi:hypothetical protein